MELEPVKKKREPGSVKTIRYREPPSFNQFRGSR